MGEIKSAFEIAQERAEGLGKPSLEDQQKWFREKCTQAGEALAEKYLDDYDLERLKRELEQYSDEEKEVTQSTCLAKLVSAVDLEEVTTGLSILTGVQSLITKKTAREMLEKLSGLLEEYREAESRKVREADKTAQELLHRLRVSGTAIAGINPGAKPEWHQNMSTIAQRCREEIKETKQELIRLFEVQ